MEEVIESLKAWNLEEKDEVVFCGYGEPTERLEDLLQVAEWIKQNYSVPTRINTNGLSDLLYGRETASMLEGKIDCVSVSLNANNAEDYNRLCRPQFGLPSYEAMLKFTADCTKYVPKVVMTVVDKVTTPAEQEEAKKIAESCGAVLRIRPFEE